MSRRQNAQGDTVQFACLIAPIHGIAVNVRFGSTSGIPPLDLHRMKSC